jgi:hypothetical protein
VIGFSRTVVWASVACTALALGCGSFHPAADEDHSAGGGTVPSPAGAGPATPGPAPDPGSAPAPGTASSPAQRVYAVFLSSQEWESDELAGLVGADDKCATLAGAPTSGFGQRKWVAWLSAGPDGARQRLGATRGPWALADGTLVATDVDHLLDNVSPLLAPISIDELGVEHQGASVWTGTQTNGDADTSTCGGWTSDSGRGRFGIATIEKPGWTNSGDADCKEGGPLFMPVNGKMIGRIYCFEID